ncbi:MAG TPA: hypothetical protein DDZ83_07080 [Nitrospinae bacterium]|nr:hypothetical protein [Nitrospinota bacterium]
MTMRDSLRQRKFTFGVIPRIRAVFFIFVLGIYGGAVFGAEDTSGKKLSVSLPEVVIESPNIERLIAQRVRPTPPSQLGIRIPKIFPRAAIPEIPFLPRPIPPEDDPDPELTEISGTFSRLFGDVKKVFESGLAYLKKNAPVEALALFDETLKLAKSLRLKAAAQFWAAETLMKLGRREESIQGRKSLLKMNSSSAGRYRAAARYALAANHCEEREYEACLRWLDSGKWPLGGFASAEAHFLRAWAHIKLGAHRRAIEVLRILAVEKNPHALKALVSIGHLHLMAGNLSSAEKAYLQAESTRTPRGKKNSDLLGEALNGVGWSRLLLGKTEEAGHAFALFFRRHPGHQLVQSAEAGALAAQIETNSAKAKRLLKEFSQKYPGSDQIAPLQLQTAWALFRERDYQKAQELAASVSDNHPLGRIYRLGRIIEGLSLYHLGKVREAFGILRSGAEKPPVGKRLRGAESSVARSAAMATAFAAFRLKDYAGAQEVLNHWAFFAGASKNAKASDDEAALWYGEAAFEAGALDLARRALKKIPRNSDEWYRAQAALAWIHYRKKEWKQAAVVFDRIFTMKPRGPLAAEALARAGEARFNLGDYAGALRAFERIEKGFAGEDVAREALLEKGKLLFRRYRLDEATDIFTRYLKKYPKSAAASEVEFWIALILFQQGRYAIARNQLLDFSERHSKSPLVAVAYLRVGDAFYNEGRYSQADRAYRLMINRFPKHPRRRDAEYGLILTRLRQKDYPMFFSESTKFIGKYGGDELAISLGFQMGEILLAQGDYDAALRTYRELLTRHGSNRLAAQALLRIANIHKRRNKLDATLDTYESLIARYPQSPLRADAVFGIAESLASVGRCAEAKERLGKFIRRYPGHNYIPVALFEAGRCAAKLGDGATAVIYLKKVVEDSRIRGSGLQTTSALLLAALLSKQGKLDDAAKALKFALLSDDPKVAAEAQYSRAVLLSRRGDRMAASEFLKLTYRYPKQTIWITRALARAGELYERAGRHTTALRIFQKMRLVAPKGAMRKVAEDAVARLMKKTGSRR